MRRQTHLPKALVFMALYGCSSTSENTPVERRDAGTQQATDAGTEQRVVGAVLAEDTFEVEVTEDVVFAQGLTHSDWRTSDGTPMDLLLDVYRPVRTEAPKMPVVVFIHGGSFMGGSHKKPEFVRMATSSSSSRVG